MDQLHLSFENLSFTPKDVILDHDVNLIIQYYYEQFPQEHINMYDYKIKKNMFGCITELYQNIIKVISQKQCMVDLLEIMPYIDEYLEYYVNL